MFLGSGAPKSKASAAWGHGAEVIGNIKPGAWGMRGAGFIRSTPLEDERSG
jgi:hypothetical protein